MRTEVKYGPSFSVASVGLDPSESIKAEAGAMVGMSGNVEIQTSTGGGIGGALKRSFLGGESFFVNTFTAGQSMPGEVLIAPPVPGDIVVWPLQDQALLVQSGSFLASSEGIEVDTSWAGAKGFFSGEGFFLLRITGMGELIVSSYGAIHGVDVDAGQTYVVDTGHVVAFSEHMPYSVRRVGGWKSTFLSGEGLVVDFTGPGRLYLQTRSLESLASALLPFLPKNND